MLPTFSLQNKMQGIFGETILENILKANILTPNKITVNTEDEQNGEGGEGGEGGAGGDEGGDEGGGDDAGGDDGGDEGGGDENPFG